MHLTIGALKPLRLNPAAAADAAGTSAAAAAVAAAAAAAAAVRAAQPAADEGPFTICDSKLQKLRQVSSVSRRWRRCNGIEEWPVE